MSKSAQKPGSNSTSTWTEKLGATLMSVVSNSKSTQKSPLATSTQKPRYISTSTFTQTTGSRLTSKSAQKPGSKSTYTWTQKTTSTSTERATISLNNGKLPRHDF